MSRPPMDPPRVAMLFSGSREWRLEHVQARIQRAIKQCPDHSVCIHGASDGFDSLVDRELRIARMTRPLHILPVEFFSHLDKQGGPVRNACMLELLLVYVRYGYRGIVHAAPKKGKSPGTYDMLFRARKHERLLKIHEWRQPEAPAAFRDGDVS